jgi:3-methyladenine DNA glycosylase Tag
VVSRSESLAQNERCARAPRRDPTPQSRDLLRRGLKVSTQPFCYALMQAIGMVNDHLVTCRVTLNSPESLLRFINSSRLIV